MFAPPTDLNITELVSPEFVRNFGILVGALVVAYLISAVLTAGAVRLTARADAGIRAVLTAELRPAVFVALLALGVWSSVALLELPARVEALALSLLASGVAVFCGQRVLQGALHIVRALTRETAGRRRMPVRFAPIADYIAHFVVWFAVLWAVAVAWELPAAVLRSWAGALGLALGLAADLPLSNLIASVVIAADRPCAPGDFLLLPSGDRGRVTRLGFRSVRVLTLDNVEFNVPNALLADSRVVNETAGDSPVLRMRISFTLALDTDLDLARRIVADMPALRGLAPGRRPELQVLALDDGIAHVVVKFWIAEPALRLPATDAVNTWLYRQLCAAGVALAHQQHDIFPDDLSALPLLADRP